MNPCPSLHKKINNLPAANQKKWIKHLQHIPCMSFNEDTVNQVIIAANSQ